MSTGYWLLDHANPHGKDRGGGLRGHFHRQRRKDIRLIGIHTAENLPDLDGDDGSAEAVARYFATTSRPASAHVNVDSDSTVDLLPDDAVAFAARGANADGLHIEFCLRTVDWLTIPESTKQAYLSRGADVIAFWCVSYDIPVKRLSREGWRAGDGGLIAHADIDPQRRSDPGKDFPWTLLLTMVRERVAEMGKPSPVVYLAQGEVDLAIARAASVLDRRPSLVTSAVLAASEYMASGHEVVAVGAVTPLGEVTRHLRGEDRWATARMTLSNLMMET